MPDYELWHSLLHSLIADGFGLVSAGVLDVFRWQWQIGGAHKVEAVLALAQTCDAVKSSLVANAIVLLTRILSAVAPLPLEWLIQHFSLRVTCLYCLIRLVVRAVLALANVLVACLRASETHTVHLLALTFWASAFLTLITLDIWTTALWNQRLRLVRILSCLENLRHLLIHASCLLIILHHRHHLSSWRAWLLWVFWSFSLGKLSI